MSCILKFWSLKISLETLERSFHRGEKTEISCEASWDVTCVTGSYFKNFSAATLKDLFPNSEKDLPLKNTSMLSGQLSQVLGK